MKFKKRTIFAIVSAILAVVIMLVLIPLVTKVTTKDIAVVRLKMDVARGSMITAEHLEVVAVPAQAVPSGSITSISEVVGKYAASQLYAGDYLFGAKLSGSSIAAEDVLAAMDGQVAISVPISSFAGALSGKLENGDIVRFYMTKDGETFVPGALQWVRVITTTTSTGIDQDEILKNEDGSYTMPASVTVLVNDAQAKFLAQYSASASFHLALIYRGDAESAQDYLDMQEAYFQSLLEDKEG